MYFLLESSEFRYKLVRICVARASLASADPGVVCESQDKIQPLPEISYIKDQPLQSNDEAEDDEGQVLGGTNVIGCVPNLSGQASCPLVMTIRCTDLYQQLINITGSILLLCAVGGPSVALPMAFISSLKFP